MFDSVLSKSGAPQGNIAGLGLSLFVCGAVATAVVFFPNARNKKTSHEVDVSFVTAKPPPPPPPPPPPASSGAQTKAVEHKIVPKKRDVVVQKKPDPEPTPTPEPQAEPQAAPQEGGQPGGVQGGVPGGVAGGVIGGVVGGVQGGVLGGQKTVLPFGMGMTRPTQVAGNPPAYSREALAARVEGKVLVKCVITVQGSIEDCKVIKGVPMLDQISLDALRTSRFTPVTYQGHPAAVQYLFTFNFKLP